MQRWKQCSFLENNNVDLVVLDVYMPHTNGFELLRTIRNRKITMDVIMVTAANDRESLEEALHLGVVDYLVKPFTFDRFQIALEKYIVQTHALKDLDTLNQINIDHIMEHTRKNNEDLFPKGIQEKTMQLILTHLRENADAWTTGDEIAKKNRSDWCYRQTLYELSCRIW